MSSRAESTGTPTASTWASGRSTSCWIRSMSWIIRSSTTSTSVPRGVNGARRWDSMNSGCAQNVGQRQDRGVEALQMPDLEDPPARAREVDQRAGLGEAGRDRLLDQDVQAGLQQPARDRAMLPGRHRDARGLDPSLELGEIAQRRDAEAAPPAAAPARARGRPPPPARPRRAPHISRHDSGRNGHSRRPRCGPGSSSVRGAPRLVWADKAIFPESAARPSFPAASPHATQAYCASRPSTLPAAIGYRAGAIVGYYLPGRGREG